MKTMQKSFLHSPNGRSCIFLSLALGILPALLSYLNLHSTLNNHDICVVDHVKNKFKLNNDDSTFRNIYGVYQIFEGSNYYFVKTPLYTPQYCLFSRHGASACGWPSSPSISNILSYRSITSSSKLKGKEDDAKYSASIYWDRGHIPLVPGKNRWCLTLQILPDAMNSKQPFTQICTTEVASRIANPNLEPYFPELPYSPPPSGTWYSDDYSHAVKVRCHLGNWNKKRHKNASRTQWNPFQNPATMLIISLQILLFVKSKYQVIQSNDASDVSNESLGATYENVVESGELWRIYTSAFSHTNFKLLIFNLYNFYVIGACLECIYGSISFFNINLALILLTGGISFLLMHFSSYIRQIYPKKKIIIQGYSAITFAWSTVMCLERSDYPILPWNSFPNKGAFNVVPILQILLMHVLFRNECSRLADILGMIIGFYIHLNTPNRELLVPQLFIPILFLIDFYCFKKILPDGISSSYVLVESERILSSGEGDEEDKTGVDAVPQTKMISPKLPNDFLDTLKNIMIGISIVSLFALDHVMAIAQCMNTYFFHLSLQANRDKSIHKRSFMRA